MNVLLILPNRWLFYPLDGRQHWIGTYAEAEALESEDLITVDLACLGMFRASVAFIALPMPDPRLAPGMVLHERLGEIGWRPGLPGELARVAPDVFARMALDLGATVTYPPVQVVAC